MAVLCTTSQWSPHNWYEDVYVVSICVMVAVWSVAGTIGHVAHGKSTVVKAISGVQVCLRKTAICGYRQQNSKHHSLPGPEEVPHASYCITSHVKY